MSIGRVVLLAGLLGSSSALAADAPLWLRYPAISPDGRTVAFSYRGDLYRVDSAGGTAFPLTAYDGSDFRPVWSRDGQQLAFASARFGNFDVFVMPSRGGPARRLTVHSADDFPSDFTPDGRSVIFESQRLDTAASSQFPSGVLPELYSVDVAGGRARRLLTLPAQDARFLAGGRRLLFHDRKGYEDPWRKHHTSAVTRDIWSYDIDAGRYTRLTRFEGEDRNPVPSPDGSAFYFLSERAGSFNVFRAALDTPDAAEQMTRFGPQPVRFLTVADDGTLCFGYDGEIWLLPRGGEARKLAVEILADVQDPVPTILPIRSDVTEMAVSPNGKEVAFVARGEVFVTSVGSDLTKRVTDTPAQERSIGFSPDGRSLVYAGERDGSWNIYRSRIVRKEEKYFFNATLLAEEPILATEANTFQPALSPDGKEVAYLEERTTLKVRNLASGETRTILTADRNFSYSDGDQYFRWSPDGKWFLVQFLQPHYWIPEVGLVSSDGRGEVINLTESGYFDSNPKWMMDGKMLTWVSNRDGLQGHAKSGPAEGDVYAMFPTQAAFDRFRLTEEEAKLLEEEEEEEGDEGNGEDEDEGDDDKGDKKKVGKKGQSKKKKAGKDDDKETPKLPEVKIELDGIRDRTARLTIHSTRLADAVVTPDGKNLLYLAQIEEGYDLWKTELRTKETSVLAKLGAEAGGALSLDKEGEHVFLLADGDLSRIEVESGEQESIGFATEMNLDKSAEHAYMFDHVWRQVRAKFYDPRLHGVDWDAVGASYRRFLPHVDNNHDYAEMLGEMLGELNASHTGARYRHRVENGDATASLGLFYDEAYSGDGLRILEVIPKNPMIKAGSRLKAGVVIEKVDGTAITAAVDVDALLNRKAGKYVLLSLWDPAKNERWDETVKPLDGDELARLLYERWIESRRRLTDARSGGRVGYVHVRSMNDPSYRVVLAEVLGRLANKEALVIDTRFNGGGDLVDDLSIFLTGRKYMDFVPPDGRSLGMEPSRRWTKPSIVLAGEGNYSDAHCFPWAYKELSIGKIVGMPVPGTCTFVEWERLQDPSLVFGVPIMGIKDSAGRFLENLELEPDIRVENEPGPTAAGRDQQLEAAVDELLRDLGTR